MYVRIVVVIATAVCLFVCLFGLVGGLKKRKLLIKTN